MKTTSLLFLILLPLTLFASEVKPGDNVGHVLATLGEPRGRAQAGGRELLCFDRGEVELTSGVVTRVALRSEEAQAKHVADTLRIREEQAIRRTQVTAEGEALKASMLADNLFQSAPLRYQVNFWRNFANRYSTVSCTEQMNLAQARLHEQEQAEEVRAEEARLLAELTASETSSRAYYPIYSGNSYAYDHRYREQRRQHRLDREYDERIHGSDKVRTDASCRDDKTHRVPARYHDRIRDRDIARDCRPAVVTLHQGNDKCQNLTVPNNSLLAAGQNVMVWDGTKMPGGEAAGLYR